jgi:WD40 repeat protein
MQIEPGQEHLLATACSDNSICIWDVRKLSQGGKPVSSVTHSLTCQSAYFAPDGVFQCFQKPHTIAVCEAITRSFASLPPPVHS